MGATVKVPGTNQNPSMNSPSESSQTTHERRESSSSSDVHSRLVLAMQAADLIRQHLQRSVSAGLLPPHKPSLLQQRQEPEKREGSSSTPSSAISSLWNYEWMTTPGIPEGVAAGMLATALAIPARSILLGTARRLWRSSSTTATPHSSIQPKLSSSKTKATQVTTTTTPTTIAAAETGIEPILLLFDWIMTSVAMVGVAHTALWTGSIFGSRAYLQQLARVPPEAPSPTADAICDDMQQLLMSYPPSPQTTHTTYKETSPSNKSQNRNDSLVVLVPPKNQHVKTDHQQGRAWDPREGTIQALNAALGTCQQRRSFQRTPPPAPA